MSVAKYAPLGGGGGIPCGDTLKFLARCVNQGAGNKLKILLVMTDGSHDGEPVTVEVDGKPQALTITGGRAQTVINGVSRGSHTVELTDRAGCFPIETPICPAN